MKFKVGDEVRISSRLCTQENLNNFGSTGIIGGVYIILAECHSSLDYSLQGSNWHKEDWLEIASIIRIGGE